MVKSYRGTGSAGYHPALLLGLLVYGYATGVFSRGMLRCGFLRGAGRVGQCSCSS
jgi:hypothetical protein